MRILLLSFYYEPDLSAGSFRTTSLVHALREQLGDDDVLEVLTTQPNRYRSYTLQASTTETSGNVRVTRFPLPAHKSGFLDQSLSFAAYARQVLQHVRGRQYDLVYATSSRLMTACLGALVAKGKRAPLYLDIRDIFVDTMRDVLASSPTRILIPLFSGIERFTMRRATRINLVSEGFREYFQTRYPDQSFRFVSNGIDDAFLNTVFPVRAKADSRRLVLYAGNIGEGQGLHRILPVLAEKTRNTHRYLIVGDGGARGMLQDAIKGADNVSIRPPVNRKELIDFYRDSDILFLHLNDYPAFHKVLPSKIFEYAATGKPILAGVSGYAAAFIGQIAGAAVFPPCDVNGALDKLKALPSAPVERDHFLQAYRRTALMQSLAHDIVSVAQADLVKDPSRCAS